MVRTLATIGALLCAAPVVAQSESLERGAEPTSLPGTWETAREDASPESREDASPESREGGSGLAPPPADEVGWVDSAFGPAPAVPPPPVESTDLWRPYVSESPPLVLREADVPRLPTRFAPNRGWGHRLVVDALPFVGDVVGILGLIEHQYRARNGMFIRTRVGPMGFAHDPDNDDRIGVFDIATFLGWDQRWFAVGIGAGVGFLRVEEELRRTEGMGAIGLLSFRGGTENGMHALLVLGGTVVEGDFVATTFRFKFRFPLAKGRVIDIDMGGAPALSWINLMAAFETNLVRRNPNSPWRIRPHVGLVEVIDDVGRDGGPGFSAGVALVYDRRYGTRAGEDD